MFKETVINRSLNWLKEDGLLIVQGSLHEVGGKYSGNHESVESEDDI